MPHRGASQGRYLALVPRVGGTIIFEAGRGAEKKRGAGRGGARRLHAQKTAYPKNRIPKKPHATNAKKALVKLFHLCITPIDS